MSDPFESHASGLESPPTRLAAIAPSDEANLSQAIRAINVATGGSVRVTTVAGDTGTIQVAAGIPFPIRVTRIWASGTTATGLVGLW